MLRAIPTAAAMCVLAAACGLVDPPPPAGTVMVHVVVRNLSDAPLGELGVKVPGGMLQGAAQPPWVPPDSSTTVAFYVPIDDEWWIALNGIGVLTGENFQRRFRECPMVFSTNLHFRCP